MELKDIRLKNGRKALADHGGVAKVSRKMGYQNPSYPVQIFGPSPTRPPSEKTCRKVEAALGLGEGSLDQAVMPMTKAPGEGMTTRLGVKQLSGMIRQVNEILQEEGVTLSSDRVATLVAMGYEDGSDDRLRTAVRMLM